MSRRLGLIVDAPSIGDAPEVDARASARLQLERVISTNRARIEERLQEMGHRRLPEVPEDLASLVIEEWLNTPMMAPVGTAAPLVAVIPSSTGSIDPIEELPYFEVYMVRVFDRVQVMAHLRRQFRVGLREAQATLEELPYHLATYRSEAELRAYLGTFDPMIMETRIERVGPYGERENFSFL